ncbi:Pentatricopeptide repeat-containing protein, chloroplastic, partial [Symbiodinium microadriaticum]
VLAANVVGRSAAMRGQLWRRSLCLLKELESDCRTDAISYLAALTSLSSCWLESLALLQDQSLRLGLSLQAAVATLGAGARSRTTAVAHSIAEAAGPWHRATSLTAALSSSREGDWQYISGLLLKMRQAQVRRNESIFSAAISAQSKAARWGEALLLTPRKLGIEANLIFRGASLPRGAWPQVLVHVAALSREGLAANAVILGSGADICAKQSALRSGFRCDTVAVNAALGPRWSGAIACTNDALSRGLDANVATYGAVIGACETPGRWETSLELLQKAARATAADALKLKPRASPEDVYQVLARHRLDHTTLRSTMRELNELKRFDLVGIVLSEALKTGAKVSSRGFTTGIRACATARDWRLAMHLFDSMRKAKVDADVISYNATISACRKGGQWQLAVHLFESACKTKIHADVVSYNATISACEKGGQWQMAVHLFDSMRKAKVDANVISYNATISACENGGQWQLAVHLFDSMRKAKVDADVISYNATISACEKGGQWQLALYLFDSMRKAKVEATVISYNAVLEAACSKACGQAEDVFLQARQSGLYDNLCNEEPTLLDLHYMSAGAGWMAVRWWLLEVLPQQLSSKKHSRCIIITGWGKSRPIWVKSDVQAFVLDKLQGHGIAAKVQKANQGCRITFQSAITACAYAERRAEPGKLYGSGVFG